MADIESKSASDDMKTLQHVAEWSSSKSLSSRPPCLSTASSDALTCILAFLTPSDLRHFFPCSRFTASFQHNDALWSSLLSSMYLAQRPPPTPTSSALPALLRFRQRYAEFPPRYFPHYRTMHSLYTQLVAFLAAKAPAIVPTLMPGLSERALRDCEEALGWKGVQWKLPLDYVCFLKFMDGQPSMLRMGRNLHSYHGIFGSIKFYHTLANVRHRQHCALHALPSLLLALTLAACRLPLFAIGCAQMRLRPLKAAIDFLLGHSHGNPGSESLLAITSSTVGSILRNGDEREESEMCFFLNEHGQVVRLFQSGSVHVVAPSFTAWLTTHLQRLQSGVYEVKPVVRPLTRELLIGGISRFAFPDPCGSDCTTNGIRVETAVLFVPEQSRLHTPQQRLQFTYRIRITHTGQSTVDATLRLRRWSIKDARGREEIVEGEGVVGLFPHVYPGCEPFEYESVCPLPTMTGSMSGIFTFQLTGRDETLDVVVAPFTFDINRNFN